MPITDKSKSNIKSIQGAYKTNGRDNENEVVVISKLSKTQYRIENPRQWDGVGIFDGTIYFGIFRYKNTMKYEPFRGIFGMHRAAFREDGSFEVHGTFLTGELQDDEFDVVWIPQ